MIKLVVFDWNGVLIADTRACMAADNHVLKTFGGRPVDLKTYRDTIIIPSINFYIKHGCNREQLIRESDKVGGIFHSFYETRATKVRTRRGAHKLLDWLSRNSITSIILSNHTVSGISFQLDRLKIKKYFKDVLANTELDSSMKKRNKEQKLTEYFNNRKLKRSEIIIIGDSPEEVEIGRRLQITTVAITNGYYSKKRLLDSKPDHMIDNLEELTRLI